MKRMLLVIPLVACAPADTDSDSGAGTEATTGTADGGMTDGGSGTGGTDTMGVDDATDGEETDGPGMTDGPTDGDPTGDEDPTTSGVECVDAGDCGGGTPFCDGDGVCVDCGGMADPDAACAGADAGVPVCEAGECVECVAGNDAACGGTTPVCSADLSCVGCVEHSECPESACHLDGADAGGCFDEGDVVMAANITALNTALSGVGAGDDLVVILSGGVDYNQTINITADVEVALLGPSGAELTGTSGLPSLNVAGNAIVYLAGPSAIDGNTGVSCSGTSVWIDDSEVRDNSQVGLDVSGGCAAHLRRTVVRGNAGGGIDASGAQVYLVNTSVSGNGGNFSTLGGLALGDTTFEATFSTVAGNNAQLDARVSLYCTGATTGSVRNSIVVGSGNSVDGCGGLTFTNSGVDQTGLGLSNDNVGALNPGWFTNPAAGDFHLSATGDGIFEDLAQWEDGDPLADFDGDAIPTAAPSHPGYDQP